MENPLPRISAWIIEKFLGAAVGKAVLVIGGFVIGGLVSWFLHEDQIDELRAEVELLKASSAYSIPKNAVSPPKTTPSERGSQWPPDLPDFPVKTNLAIKDAKHRVTVSGTFQDAEDFLVGAMFLSS